MKKTALLTTLCLIGAASAQQNVKAVFAPVTIDGVTTQNGLITVNGKTYVSVDALKARGATILKTDSVGLYSFPAGNGVKTKLSGCANEWLTDGVNRLRIIRQGGGNDEWAVVFNFQSSQEYADIEKVFRQDKVYAQFKDGGVFEPLNDPFAKSRMLMSRARGGEVKEGHVEIKMPDRSEDNPAVKVVLRPVNGSPWTFDLTCKK